MIAAKPLPVQEPGDAARARRAALSCARRIGFGEYDAGRAALVATEAATNLLRHAGGGELLVMPRDQDASHGLRILALDRGPGFAEGPARRDGFSTVGGAGTGLGAMERASDRFAIYSQPGNGAAVLSEIFPKGPAAEEGPFEVAGFSVAKPGEEVCGDGWAVSYHEAALAIVLLDGLGHGEGAFEVSRAGVAGFRTQPRLRPEAQLVRLHELLRPTRGAAAAVVQVDCARHQVAYSGIGNTLALIDSGDAIRHLPSHNGTVGHQMPRVREFTYAWPAGAVLLMATDGLTSRVSLAAYPGLRRRPPALIAGVLYRDFRRGRDDATILVVAEGSRGGEPGMKAT
jgi:anti-sigma regulatory factor (Ser/Thr protein kinase)